MSKLTPYQIIANLGGVTVTAVNEWAYEVGVSFLEHMREPEAVHYELERSEVFWKWWTVQFEKLAMGLVNSSGDLATWKRMGKAAFWQGFKDFTWKKKIGDWGQRSYCQLLSEYLEPQFRKKRKQQQEFERAGLEIINH
jgi:hypothetical protein